MATISEYLNKNVAGVINTLVGVWVRVSNNKTAATFVSTGVTDGNGLFTINNVPAGLYTIATGPSNTGPWTNTGDNFFNVPDEPYTVNVMDYGAKGDGVTDDTTAIEAAFTAAGSTNKILFPAGNFVYNGAGLGTGRYNIEGVGYEGIATTHTGGTSITLGASSYFLSYNGFVTSLFLKGIKFRGGLGAIYFNGTGANVGMDYIVENCYFSNYTQTAIGHTHSDMPDWKIVRCTFFGANSTSTIGVALAGYVDHCSVISCEFSSNKVHLKAGLSGNNLIVSDCDFLQWGGGSGRINIWIVPNPSFVNAGAGLLITASKFGNENQDATDYRVVYADELAGTDFTAKLPNLASDSVGYISGHTITDSKISGNFAIPIIYSTTPNVLACNYSGVIDGTAPSYIIQFRTVPLAGDRNNTNNIFGPFSFQDGPTIQTIPASNAIGVGTFIDPNGFFSSNANAPSHILGMNDGIEYVNLLSTPATSFLFGGSSSVGATDSLGGTDAVTATMPIGTSIYASPAVMTVGMPVWIEFELKSGGGTPLSFIEVEIDLSNVPHWRRTVPLLSSWRRYQFLYIPRVTNVDALAFINTTGSSGTFMFGRARMYHARQPYSNVLSQGANIYGNLALVTATSRIVPGSTSLSLRNNANNADNLIITDAGAATFRSTVGGITTLTATTLGGTLSTAAQTNVTSVGTLTSLTTSGNVTFSGSTAGTNTSGSLSITANNTPASGGRAEHIWIAGTLTQSTNNSTMVQVRLDATTFAGGGFAALNGAIGLDVEAQNFVSTGTAPAKASAISFGMPTIGTTTNTGISMGTTIAGAFGFFEAGTLTQIVNAGTMEQIRLGATVFAGGAFTAGNARGLLIDGAGWTFTGTQPVNGDALFINMPTIGTGRNVGIAIGGSPPTGTYGIYQVSTDANVFGGGVSVGGNLTLTTAVSRIVPGATSLSLRNNANNADNLIIVDAGDATLRGSFTMSDAKNIILGSTTGNQIGTAITQKMGFYGATAIAQRAGAAQVAVITTASTNAAPFGYATGAQADALVTLVNELRAWAVAQGFIKGAA